MFRNSENIADEVTLYVNQFIETYKLYPNIEHTKLEELRLVMLSQHLSRLACEKFVEYLNNVFMMNQDGFATVLDITIICKEIWYFQKDTWTVLTALRHKNSPP